METRELQLDYNYGGQFDDPESMEPGLRLQFIEGVQSGRLNTTTDVRRWLGKLFTNADKIRVKHGIVQRTRNRLDGVGKNGKSYRLRRDAVEKEIPGFEEKRALREEAKSKVETDLGKEFVAAHHEFLRMILDCRFSGRHYGDNFKEMIAQTKIDFLAGNPDGAAIFDKYLIVIIQKVIAEFNRYENAADLILFRVHSLLINTQPGTFEKEKAFGEETIAAQRRRGFVWDKEAKIRMHLAYLKSNLPQL